MQLTADWTLFTKLPKDTQDYRSLAKSLNSLAPHEYEQLVRNYHPGTPHPDANDPTRADALPWVWFGPSGGSVALGVAVMDFGFSTDRSGRRTDPTRYFRLRWDEVGSKRPTYAALYRAVLSVPLDATDGPAIQLRVESPDFESVIQRLEANFDIYARIAAWVLDQPVRIVDAGVMPLDERLDVLDAIAALLPYGFRADLAASTWVTRGVSSGKRLRLAFGERSDDGRMEVNLQAGPISNNPVSDEVVRYLRHLKSYQQRQGTLALVKGLAADFTPHSFEQPSVALNRLAEIDRPYAVWQNVRDGQGNAQEVRKLFRDGQDAVLETDQQRDLIGFLFLQASEDDLELIERHFSAAHWPHLFVALVQSTAADPAPSRLIDRYFGLAKKHRQADGLIANLLTVPDAATRYVAESGEKDRHLAAPLREIQGYDAATRGRIRARALGEIRQWGRIDTGFPEVKAALLANPALAYDLLADETESINLALADSILDSLLVGTPVAKLPAALRPLSQLRHGENVSEDNFSAVAALSPKAVRQLVRFAEQRSETRALQAAIWTWLLSAGRLEPSQQQEWLAILRTIRDANLSSRTVAWSDLLTLAIGSPLSSNLDRTLASPTAAEYLDEFYRRYWNPALDRQRSGIALALASAVGGLDWTRPNVVDRFLRLLRNAAEQRVSAVAVADAPSETSSPQFLDSLVQVVIQGVERDSSVLDAAEYRGWWESVVKREPKYRLKIALAKLQRVNEGTPEPDAIEACAEVLRAAPNAVDSVVDHLAQVGYFPIDKPERIAPFVNRVINRLDAQSVTEAQRWDLFLAFPAEILENRVNFDLAQAYRAYLVRTVPTEFIRCGFLLTRVRDDLTEVDTNRIRTTVHGLAELMKQPRRHWIPTKRS